MNSKDFKTLEKREKNLLKQSYRDYDALMEASELLAYERHVEFNNLFNDDGTLIEAITESCYSDLSLLDELRSGDAEMFGERLMQKVRDYIHTLASEHV